MSAVATSLKPKVAERMGDGPKAPPKRRHVEASAPDTVGEAVSKALQQASVLLSFLVEADNLEKALGAPAELFVAADIKLATAAYPEKGFERPIALAEVTELSSALDSAMEALDAAPGPYVGTALLAATLTSQAQTQLARIGNALRCVPTDLATLKELGTYAGSRPYRVRPRPSIRHYSDTYRHSAEDVQRVFEAVSMRCLELRDFLAQARLAVDAEAPMLQTANQIFMAECVAAHVGSIADDMAGHTMAGGPASWATGDGIEPIGGAA